MCDAYEFIDREMGYPSTVKEKDAEKIHTQIVNHHILVHVANAICLFSKLQGSRLLSRNILNVCLYIATLTSMVIQVSDPVSSCDAGQLI